MPTPEALAREIIDQKLTAAGWMVQGFKALNLGAVPLLKRFPQLVKSTS